jgi:hypothetical protein
MGDVSKWDQNDLTAKVVEVLQGVRRNNDQHHFGRPYITAYQLAFELQRVYPETVEAIGKPLGGSGVGQHDSVAQYLANELSRRIKTQGLECPVEGAFLSNQNVRSMTFTAPKRRPGHLIPRRYRLRPLAVQAALTLGQRSLPLSPRAAAREDVRAHRPLARRRLGGTERRSRGWSRRWRGRDGRSRYGCRCRPSGAAWR